MVYSILVSGVASVGDEKATYQRRAEKRRAEKAIPIALPTMKSIAVSLSIAASRKWNLAMTNPYFRLRKGS
jgi:hypothetical protein